MEALIASLALLGVTVSATPSQGPIPELKRLADLDLRPSSPWLDLASVSDWTAFGDGIAIIAWRGTLAEYELFLDVYGGDGKLVREVALPSKEGLPIGAATQLAGLPGRICALGEHELGVLPERTGDHEFVGQRIDPASGTLSPWPIPVRIDAYSRAIPLPGGDFLEFAVKTPDRVPGLRRLAPDGTIRWTLDRASGFWADGGLTLAGDGGILAWNERDPPAIQVVTPAGRVSRTVLLKESLPDISIVRDIAVGTQGQVYLDIGEPNQRRVVPLDAAWRPLPTLVPQFENGSSAFRSIHGGPDGSLWIYDGFCFARLLASGMVQRIIGPAPGTPVLQSARTVHIANDGRIFAFSDRDGTLFELGAAAKVLGVFEPSDHGPAFRYEDLEWQMAPPELATRYRWHSFDEGRRLWRIKGTRALLLRADETEVLGVTLAPVQLSEVEARPLAVSRAGLFALQLTGAGPPELRVLDPQGAIRARVPRDASPIRSAALDEQHLALTTASSVELYDMSGQLVGRAEIPSDRWLDMPSCGNQTDDKWRVDLRPQSKELWLRQGPNTLIVRRYALP